MATIVVATNGNDTTGTGSSLNPYRTIQRGHDVAGSGDTVLVKGDPAGVAVYAEQVQFTKSNVSFLGDATYRPVLDSNYTLGAGFYTYAGPSNVTIDNFEIRRYTNFGVTGYGQTGNHNCVIQNCYIHHIKPTGPHTLYDYSYGVYLAYGNWRVLNNEIAYISGWNESTGVWFGYCHDHVADGNLIYSVRKEGIRSYMGNKIRAVNNICCLCWFGLEPNCDAQGLWANNYVYHCQAGINPKHTNDWGSYDFATSTWTPASWTVMGYWGIDRDDPSTKFTRFYHNTCHRNVWGHLVHAINITGDGTGYTTQCDVRNNIFSGKCGAYFWDWPWARVDPHIVDYNCYSPHPYGPDWSQPHPIYQYDWDFNNPAKTRTMAQLRSTAPWSTPDGTTVLGFEIHGMELDPQLNDPDHGDLDYPNSSPVHNAGVDLTSFGSEWGTQMGARGLSARVTYNSHLLAPVRSSSPYSPGAGAWDENLFTFDYTYPQVYDGTNPLEIIADLGSPKTFNHIHSDVQRHAAEWNPARMRFDGSNTSNTGPWEIICDDQVFDPGGTGWNIDLPSKPTYRWIRYRADPFGGTYVLVNDVRVGLISDLSDPPPSVTLLQPVTGSSISGDVYMQASASDNVGISRVDFFANNVQVGTDSTAPYDCTWTTTHANAGTVTLEAHAYDIAGNVKVSSPVVITVTTPALVTSSADYWGVLDGS